MGSIDDIMQLCRLCLVKDQVNIPIFDETSDIRQTFLKINQCLPVKVSRDDNLPKKICDGCSYKLDMLYVFRNTSVDSEKQLLSWLSQTGLGSCSLPQTVVKDGVTKPEIMVKQETFEASEARIDGDNPDLNVDAQQDLGVDAHTYIMQQQKLPYQQDFAAFGEPSGSTNIVSEEPAPKKPRRAAMTKKHVPIETEEDTLDTTMQITKAEEEDSDDVDQPDYVVEAPSASADDQPGPSGVGKGTIEAPQIIDIVVKGDGPIFLCTTCWKTFKTKEQLRGHGYTHTEKKQKCQVCHKTFRFPSNLRKHMRWHREERPFVCEICGDGFKIKGLLDFHLQRHNGYRFPCDQCDSGFRQRSELLTHRREVHEGKRVKCEHCEKLIAPSYYAKHLRVFHSDDKEYRCGTCNKVVYGQLLYDEHMKLHMPDLKKMCEICGKQVWRRSWQHHLLTHTGEKPYICSTCGRRFNCYRILINHERIHSQEKPFICEICGKSFTQSSTLNKHRKFHPK